LEWVDQAIVYSGANPTLFSGGDSSDKDSAFSSLDRPEITEAPFQLKIRSDRLQLMQKAYGSVYSGLGIHHTLKAGRANITEHHTGLCRTKR
jgi:hypothetical protein